MNTLVKSILIGASITMALAACSPEKDKEQVRITANNRMNSQELANAGEQLMMPHTLNLADRVFEMALEKDPENLKAQFYRSFLKRFMIFEGIFYRLKPYVENYGDSKLYLQSIENIPNHPLKKFLLGAPEVKLLPLIHKASELQALLIEYRKAVESFRSFVTQHADMTLELYLNPILFEDRIDENLKDSCEVISGSSKDDISVVCDPSNKATAKVNMADLIAIKQLAAGEILYLTFYTSYSVGSIDDVIKDTKDKNLSQKEIFEKIHNINDAGLLLKDQSMTMMRELGSDFGVALKWALKYQDNLCKKDSEGRIIPRKGFMMKNICITNKENAQNTLAVLERILAGTMKITLNEGSQIELNMNISTQLNDPLNDLGKAFNGMMKVTDGKGKKVEKNLNFITLFDRPLRDLRRLMPATWNTEGTAATSLKDKTAGGLFPDGDVNDILKDNESK